MLTAEQITQIVAVMRATEPRPPHVTRGQAADMLGISAPTLRRLVARGVLRPNACGMIPITQIDAAIAARP